MLVVYAQIMSAIFQHQKLLSLHPLQLCNTATTLVFISSD